MLATKSRSNGPLGQQLCDRNGAECPDFRRAAKGGGSIPKENWRRERGLAANLLSLKINALS